MVGEIKLLISDFDGTLVDTFMANFKAYKKAFSENGLMLSEAEYRQCFGLRFDDFMQKMNVAIELRHKIREMKSEFYPEFFCELRVNVPLLHYIRAFKRSRRRTALASTARRRNLMNVLKSIEAVDAFDFILAGEDVTEGKPSPEVYEKVIRHFDIKPANCLVFEDSEVGIQSAVNAGLNYIRITPEYYGN
jgi:beta-phosphoglucomutase